MAVWKPTNLEMVAMDIHHPGDEAVIARLSEDLKILSKQNERLKETVREQSLRMTRRAWNGQLQKLRDEVEELRPLVRSLRARLGAARRQK